jgi:broad specificity phosphatase PhoE
VEKLIVVRHAHSESNERDVVSCLPPGDGLSLLGVEQSFALREQLGDEPIDLGLASELLRAQETLDFALAAREVPIGSVPGLNEIDFGSFEGGRLSTYRRWAWTTEPDAPCPGGGESRIDAALRFAGALDELLALPEQTVLVVTHGLPVRYVLEGSEGRFPPQRIGHVEQASPFRLDADAVRRAAETLRAWAQEPRFAPS